MFTAGPAFTALAALWADRPPERADLLYDAAPFGVGYLVAIWTGARSGAADAVDQGATG